LTDDALLNNLLNIDQLIRISQVVRAPSRFLELVTVLLEVAPFLISGLGVPLLPFYVMTVKSTEDNMPTTHAAKGLSQIKP